MGRARKYFLALIAVAVLTPMTVSAQYYSWGTSPSSIHWQRLKTDSLKIIYPDYWQSHAYRTLFYFDTVRPYIAHGFTKLPATKLPVIIQTQNLNSNGVVTYAPKRIELMSMPDMSREAYAEPWFKHLVAHEYRHSVQFSNLNRSTVRVFSTIMGQQGLLIGALLVPMWFLEGDAVMSETQMTTYGRALQPSFTMEYRAIGPIKTRKWQIDRWFCGSYKYNIPDHYKMGYQMTRYSYERYGYRIWDKTIRYCADYPFLIVPRDIALKKYYGTSGNRLFKDSFEALNAFWDSLPKVENTSHVIPTPVGSYTTYSYPMFIDANSVVAFKEDFDSTQMIVKVDVRTGREQLLARIGIVSSRPALCGGRLYWTEYRQSTIWRERVNSALCCYDFQSGRKYCIRRPHQIFFPVEGDGDLCYVTYDYGGRFSIRNNSDTHFFEFADSLELHGLAWDSRTERLYFIALGEQGEFIGALRRDWSGFDVVTEPRFITLSDLRAQDGTLYFGSIVSGKDEAHALDLASGAEYRLTNSTYGSFQPSPDAEAERAVVTTYDKQGYKLALQTLSERVVQPLRELPVNLVNPPTRSWGVPNLDTIRYTATADSAQRSVTIPRKYRKGLTGFNFHSWAPFDFNPFEILSDGVPDFNVGATAISQNLLSSMEFYASYGWSRLMGSRLRTALQYYGWGPSIGVAFTYGGGNQMLYNRPVTAPRPVVKPALNVALTLSQPLTLSSGARYRRLTPLLGFSYSNDIFYSNTTMKPHTGIFRMSGSLSYYDQCRMAHRDFLPRWGYALKLSFVSNPLNPDFRTTYLAYARFYMPGVAPHNSTTLQLGYQASIGNRPFGFRVKELFPRGAEYDFTPRRYGALALDYQVPVAYPDWGIPSVLFIRRVRLGVFFDYACYQTLNDADHIHNLFSYGANVTLDVVPIRLPSNSNTSVTVTVAKPSDRSGVAAFVSFSLPI